MSITPFLGLVLLLALGGCDRNIKSSDPIRSLPSRPEAPTSVTAQLNDRTVTVTWDSVTGASQYRLLRSDSENGVFSVIDSTAATSLVASGLPYDRAIWLGVEAVSTAGYESDLSTPVEVRAGRLSLTMANGAEYTNRREVQVRFEVPTPTAYVELADNVALTDAELLTYQTFIEHQLPAGDGLKHLYAQITFTDGSLAGEIVHDSIILDTEAQIDSVTFSPSGQQFSVGDTIYFNVYPAGETGGSASVSFPGVQIVDLFDDGSHGDTAADDGVFTSWYVVPVGLIAAGVEVTGAYVDPAGNRAVNTISAELLEIVDLTPPSAVTIAVGLIDSSTARLTWTQNSDDGFESYRVYRAVNPGFPEQEQFVIAILNEQNVLTYDDYLSSSGVYHYRVSVVTTAGVSTTSNEVSVTR